GSPRTCAGGFGINAQTRRRLGRQYEAGLIVRRPWPFQSHAVCDRVLITQGEGHESTRHACCDRGGTECRSERLSCRCRRGPAGARDWPGERGEHSALCLVVLARCWAGGTILCSRVLCPLYRTHE